MAQWYQHVLPRNDYLLIGIGFKFHIVSLFEHQSLQYSYNVPTHCTHAFLSIGKQFYLGKLNIF
jgi:hypothetical protein